MSYGTSASSLGELYAYIIEHYLGASAPADTTLADLLLNLGAAIQSHTGGGSVTTVSVATANGMAGTVATPTTTPVITLSTTVTGIVKANGTNFAAASAGTDYLAPSGNGSALTGITVAQVSGAMATSTYDPAAIAQQVVGTTATQTLTNKTLTAPTVTSISGTETVVKPINNAVTVTSNAGTVPVTSKLSTFTNSSAATMAITIATASATDGQPLIVRIYDFSAAAQTIGWTNTENSTVSVPTTSNGSTTLPLTVGFMFNAATTKWRCVASA